MHVTMNVEFINPFLSAAMNVLSTMTFTEATPRKPYLKEDSNPKGAVTGIINISGQAEGTLAITFSHECICHLVANMFGEKIDTINQDVKDAVGELTNMISGGARRQLAESGLPLQAGIPEVLSGPTHKVEHPLETPAIAVPFETPGGDFTIEVCLSD
jgi:chemotaxis protein CheX